MDSPEETHITRQTVVVCLSCGHYVDPDTDTCPQCGGALAPRTLDLDHTQDRLAPITRNLVRIPEPGNFRPDASLILQFLPQGDCVSLALRNPITLGRGLRQDVEKLLDLTGHEGLENGVSRQHCSLQRRGNRLIVTDLGSTNGTYLDNERLPPYQDHFVCHGDRLTLGRLHLQVLFSTTKDDDKSV
jgi:hypothetical protein